MSSRPPGSRVFALIIGIDDYTQEISGFPRLKGAVRDADRIRIWLINDFNVPPSQIRDLRNEAACRKAIIQALEDLAANSEIERDDPILIYYAGHGSEAPAPKSWQWDSLKIQMIVPWDFKRPDGPNRIIQGIPDRTLGRLLTKLAEEKGDNITVIFDSCYSGSGTRSESNTRIRGGPHEGVIPADLDDNLVPSTRGVQASDKFRHYGLRSHVLLAACAPHEFAHEAGDSGAFTGALLRALDKVNTAELTYQGLIERMETLTTQTPQCEGYNRDRFLFNRKVANTQPVLNATLKGEILYIAGAGAIHGISEGCTFAIWRSSSDIQNSPLGTVIVKTVTGSESIAPFDIDDPSDSESFVAQIKEISKPQLSVHIPQVIQDMDCFKTLFSKEDGRHPFSFIATQNRDQARVGLTHCDGDSIGFEILDQAELEQRIPYIIEPNADELHRALDHLCRYYYHRDRVNTKAPNLGDAPFSSKFTVEVFTLEMNEAEIFVPSGPNLNVVGVGVKLTIGRHNEHADYGFKITNHTNLNVYPYLFYFDSSDFSITPIYQPVAVAQTGGAQPSIPSLPGHGSLAVGYGSTGSNPLNFKLSNGELNVEHGYLRLYVSTRYVELSSLQQGGISRRARGLGLSPPSSPLLWDVITVPVVMKRGTKPNPPRMIGIIGSRTNGKNAFLEELSKSLYGNPKLNPSFTNGFIKEYDIALPDPNGGSLTLVDLPAFEDNNIDSHSAMLRPMVAYLGNLFPSGRRFTALIWCYDISKQRFNQVDEDNIDLVKDISGPNALKNVVVLTTNWNKGAGAGTNAVAKTRTVAALASPLKSYEDTEAHLQSLFGGGVQFIRFGTFSESSARERMLGSTSAGDPLELIRSLLANKAEVLQVQAEACELRTLAETTAGKTLKVRFETGIKKKEKEIRRLEDELDELDEDDNDRIAIQEEKIDAQQDILRWRKTLEDMEVVNSAFI